MVGRYTVVSEIAHGGMAAVFAVTFPQSEGVETLLAMKVLLPHLSADPRFVTMFIDEARIAARIHHPNVVQMLEVGRDAAMPFMVMELLRGRTLSSLNKAAGGELPLDVILLVLSDVARGLHGAHTTTDDAGQLLHVVHRDVSPQNVHVGYDGTVKIVDFGIAAARGRESQTRSGELKGKLAYMAPEQIHRSVALDPRTDLWALGVMAWQLLAREPLFRGDSDATTLFNILNATPPDIQAKRADVPDEVATLVMACLDRSPDRRPKDAELVADAFERAIPDGARAARRKLVTMMSTHFESARATETTRLSEAMRAARQKRSTGATGPAERGRAPLWLGIGVLATVVAAGAWSFSQARPGDAGTRDTGVTRDAPVVLDAGPPDARALDAGHERPGRRRPPAEARDPEPSERPVRPRDESTGGHNGLLEVPL